MVGGGIKTPLFVYVNAAYVCLKGWIVRVLCGGCCFSSVPSYKRGNGEKELVRIPYLPSGTFGTICCF